MRIDIHVHTLPRSPCSTMTPEEAVRAAMGAGLEGVVFSEHDTLWTEDELAQLRRKFGEKLKIFAGVEVSCEEGHFICLGLEDDSGLYHYMPAGELIALAHGNAAVVIAAHPYRYSVEQGDTCYGLDIDGVEVDSSNTTAEGRRLALELAERTGVAAIESSDSHSTTTVGRYSTEFEGEAGSIRDLAESIRRRNRLIRSGG